MKKNIYYYNYNRLLALFHKLQSRLLRNFSKGRFKQLSRHHQYKLLQRLEKLKIKLSRLENGMKYGSMTMAAAAGLSLIPASAMAQFAPEGTEFRVNTHTTGNQLYQKMAMDKDGDFVVTWASRGQDDGLEYGIYAQCYNAKGEPTTEEFRVNTYTTGRQTSPSIAMDDDGDFVIAWTSSGQDGDLGGVFAQRFHASGAANGGEFRVNTHTTGNQYSSAVAMDSDGDFVVTWSSPQDANTYGILARQYDNNGVAKGAEFLVNTHETGVQRFSSVAMDTDGDFVIAWPSDRDGSSYGVYARLFNPSGNAKGGEFQVNTYTTGSQNNVKIAMDQDGDFTIVWQSSQDGSSSGIYAQRFNTLGVKQGSEFLVNTYTTNSQDSPSISMDDDGNFVVAWSSSGQDGDAKGIYGQRYNSAGTAQGSEFKVNTYTAGDQSSPSIAMDNDKDFVIVWSSLNNQDGSASGVYAQKFVENFAPDNIDLSNASINENVAATTEVGKLTSTDPDKGDTFTYALVTGTGDTDNASFQIVGDKLQIKSIPDFETKNSFSIRISSSDQKGLSFEKVFTITITDVNEAPTDLTLSPSSVDENVAANTEVGTFSTTDADASNTFSYALVSGTGDTDNASFQITGNSLQILNSPDFENKNSYSIRVSSTDQDGLSIEKVFNITVNNLVETGVDEAFSSNIQLHPNPSRNAVHINLEGTVSVRILDLSGQLMKTTSTNNKVINIDGIPSGIYLLEITQNNKIGLKKLVID